MSSQDFDAGDVIGFEAFRDQALVPADRLPVPVLDTSEVRWFAEGLLPQMVVDWFTCGGTAGTLEERCDTYLLHSLHDIGVKRRSRTFLEVKVRRGVGKRLVLAPGLTAPLEEWRKWSPWLGSAMAPSAGGPWIDVEKVVLTRTIWVDHEELGPVPDPDRILSGCEVEIVAVRVADVEAWSFAFEAFGPRAYRSRLISSAWKMLIDTSGALEQPSARLSFAGGYPEWLARITSDPNHRSVAEGPPPAGSRIP